jgi:NodT family efflux transporter outer membrane factor (OMF) lipoprotein
MSRALGNIRTDCPALRLGLFAIALFASGCTPFTEYVHNGFKVGPNYQQPSAPVADAWIDAGHPAVKSVPANDSAWWHAFRDPVLDDLVRTAYAQNVTLRIAVARVLEARDTRAIAVGQLFPQSQTANGAYQHIQVSQNLANVPPVVNYNDWATGLNASWEIDFWGKIRRSIESADDLLDASIDDYDNVMVTLIGDVAAAYAQYRIFEQQLVYAQQNVNLQRGSLKIATERYQAGQANEIGVLQANSLLEQLESTIPVIEIGIRQSNNQLCILLGIPPVELAAKLGRGGIPVSPPEILVGIPADLLRRRPDLRAAERRVAAQNAQIGVAESALLPAFFINGTIGYEAKDLQRLFASGSFTGQVGPAFQWQILNYGRLLNNVRLQKDTTQELVEVYRQNVLSAGQEVENGIVTYLKSRIQADHLALSVKDAARTVTLTNALFRNGAIDYTPVFVAEQFLAQQQNLLAQADGNVALGMIGVYRALGGGWEVQPPPPASTEIVRPNDQPIEVMPALHAASR